MKRKILYLMVITLLVLTGCTSKANIEIDYDGKVKENVVINFNNSSSINFDSPTAYVKSYIEYYKSAINLKKYTYEINEKKESTNVSFKNNYDNICSGIKYGLFTKTLYNDISCVEDEYYYTIKSNGEQLVSKPLSEKQFNIEKLELNIVTKGLIVENNADKVDGNTYTWIFDQNTDSNKNIMLKISKSLMEKQKQDAITKEKNKHVFSKVKILGIVIFIILCLGLIISYLYKKYKNNKIEY